MIESIAHETKRRVPPWACGAALVALHAALLAWSAARASVTFDEYAHLPAGVSYWKTGDFSVYNLSPPLLRLWAAWPAALAGAEAPPVEPFRELDPKDRHWSYAEAFLDANRQRYHHYFVLGRLAMIPLSCTGLWIVYCWALQLYGTTGGSIAGLLYALCPNLLAHGSLVTTDAGTTVIIVAAMWTWWRFCERPRWPNGGLAALLVAAALLCKFTSLLLWPILFGLAICAAWREPKRRKPLAVGLALTALACVLLINAAYRFSGSGKGLDTFPFRSSFTTSLQRVLPDVPVPLPEQFVIGFDVQKWEAETGQPAFLLGQQYRGSKWYYYPIGLLCKLPLGTIGLLLLAITSLVRARRTGELPLLVAAAVLLVGMIILPDINIGVRYVLPVMPLLFILAGRLAGAPKLRRAVVPLLALVAIENALAAPRYISFFNLGVRAAGDAYHVLNDSNFDWGQGLIDLKRWMDANDVPRVHLGYFGRVDPGVYGIDYVPLNEPSGERYVVVSGYFLVGLPHRMPTPRGPTGFVRIDFHEQLRRKRPVAVVGDVLFVYDRADVADAIAEYHGRAH